MSWNPLKRSVVAVLLRHQAGLGNVVTDIDVWLWQRRARIDVPGIGVFNLVRTNDYLDGRPCWESTKWAACGLATPETE